MDTRLVSHSEMGPYVDVVLASHDPTAALRVESSTELAAAGVGAVPAGVGTADDGAGWAGAAVGDAVGVAGWAGMGVGAAVAACGAVGSTQAG